MAERNAQVETEARAPVVVNGIHNAVQMQQYNCENDDWIIYKERLEQFFISTRETNERKVNILLSLLENNTYKILRSLIHPDLPHEKTYEVLCETLKDRFGKVTAAFKERIKFESAKQEPAEGVRQWYTRVRNLATTCEFRNLEEMVLNKFVCAMKKGRTQNRICEESVDTGIQRLLQIAVLREESEAAEEDEHHDSIKWLARGGSSGNKLTKSNWTPNRGTTTTSDRSEPKDSRRNIIRQGGQDYWQRQQRRTTRWPNVKNVNNIDCKHCGGRHHNNQKCKFEKAECYNCHKIGHLSKICRNTNNSRVTNYYTEISDVPIYNVSFTKPIIIDLIVNKIPLSFELDTGSGLSIISEESYKSNFKNIKIIKTKLNFKGFTGESIKTLGYINVNVQFKNDSNSLKLFIVNKGRTSLLGRDFLNLFKIAIDIYHIKSKIHTVAELTEKYKSIFDGKLGCYKNSKIRINIDKSFRPVFHKPRPIPFAYRTVIDKELDKLQQLKIITPMESNDWGTPLVPVLKGDGKIRICGDYKVTLNQCVEANQYPLPRIEELLAALSNGEEFSKVDLSRAYNQIELDEESSRMCAWSTHRGIYKVNRLPFGISIASGIFQSTMDRLLQGTKGTICYLDDILVTGKNREEHMENLENLFKILEDNNLKVRLNKCEFFKKQISYLGFLISKEGLQKNMEKCEAIVKAPQPKNLTELRAFCGLVNFYGKFIPNLASIMRPMYELLLSNARFEWQQEQDEAFRQIKTIMISDTILVHYNPEVPVILDTDASLEGISGVLQHRFKDGSIKPIAFYSRSLTQAEKNYSVIDREALAIFSAVRKFNQYLLGRKFVIRTDHKPLLAIFGEKRSIPQMAASRMQRWAIYLANFSYEINYIKGTDNGAADAISRLPLPEKENMEDQMSYLNFIIQDNFPMEVKRVVKETRRDPILAKVHDLINTGWPYKVEEELKTYHTKQNELTTEEKIVMWGHRVVIPTSMRKGILCELHSGHLGIVKTKALARSYVWWPNIDKDIENLVKGCKACLLQRDNPEKVPLTPWNRPNRPFERIHIDLCGPIKGKQFLIVLDAYSKWVEAFAMDSTTSEKTIALLKQTFARFGIPEMIVSDNGTQFTSEEFAMFRKRNGIKHYTTAPGNPATNGAAENAVKTFKRSFKAALADERNSNTDLNTLMQRFLMNYRNIEHNTTGEPPTKLMFGRKIRSQMDLIKPSQTKSYERKIEQQKINSGGRRRIDLAIGDKIMIRDYSNPNKKQWKPAEIIKRMGTKTYLCKLEDERVWKRHVNQIMAVETVNDPSSKPSYPNPIINSGSRVISYNIQTPIITDVVNDNQAEMLVNENIKVKKPLAQNNSFHVTDDETIPFSAQGNRRNRRIVKLPKRFLD